MVSKGRYQFVLLSMYILLTSYNSVILVRIKSNDMLTVVPVDVMAVGIRNSLSTMLEKCVIRNLSILVHCEMMSEQVRTRFEALLDEDADENEDDEEGVVEAVEEIVSVTLMRRVDVASCLLPFDFPSLFFVHCPSYAQ